MTGPAPDWIIYMHLLSEESIARGGAAWTRANLRVYTCTLCNTYIDAKLLCVTHATFGFDFGLPTLPTRITRVCLAGIKDQCARHRDVGASLRNSALCDVTNSAANFILSTTFHLHYHSYCCFVLVIRYWRDCSASKNERISLSRETPARYLARNSVADFVSIFNYFHFFLFYQIL